MRENTGKQYFSSRKVAYRQYRLFSLTDQEFFQISKRSVREIDVSCNKSASL